jgi:hypothetical protein
MHAIALRDEPALAILDFRMSPRKSAMRFRTIRRSVSSCVSPGPRVPMPMPPLWPLIRSRWFHMRAKRG